MQPDIIPERIELRPALSSTGDMPVFLSPSEESPPAEPEPVPPPASPEETSSPEEPAAGGEPAPEAPAEPPQEAKPDPRTLRIRAAEERADRLERGLQEAIATIKALTEQKQTEPPPAPKPDPTLEPLPSAPLRTNFDNPEDYDAALVEWASRRALTQYEATRSEKAASEKAAADKRAADDAVAQQQRELQTAWASRRAKFIEAHEDYTAVAENPDLPVTAPMALTIANAEDGPAIAYWLGQNPQEAARIATIQSPPMVIYEIGRISAKLATPPPQVTRAPAPIRPLGANAAATEKSPDDMSMDEYAASRLRKIQAERKPFIIGGAGPRLQ